MYGSTWLRHDAGAKSKGIYSVCSAHPWVLEAVIDQALEDESDVLIEATSNQVNHLGGYTGMLPEDFRQRVIGIAASKGFNESRLILGGDHLGPNPWQKQPAHAAMLEAERMVEAYVRAGFQKIHLDASMACAGDQRPTLPARQWLAALQPFVPSQKRRAAIGSLSMSSAPKCPCRAALQKA